MRVFTRHEGDTDKIGHAANISKTVYKLTKLK